MPSQRKQFGRAIADFQVLQHRMVDMFTAGGAVAVSMTYMATLRNSAKPDQERARPPPAPPRCRSARPAAIVGQNAIQLHGGMGMTDELSTGHYFKRATIIEGLFGDVDHHLKRYERLALPKAA